MTFVPFNLSRSGRTLLPCRREVKRSRAPVNQRTKRLTRCQRCHTERADGLNSLTAVHPELVREWDEDANAPLRPERIKATYDKTVVWRCRDDPTHPSYRMSPYARAKVKIGCRICRKRQARDVGAAAAIAA